MMKKILLLAGYVGVSAAMLMTTGCRTPKIGAGTRGATVPPMRDMRGPGGTELEWPSEAEWQGMDASLTGPGAAQSGAERRWEGVAVYFAYDRATIGASERPKIDTIADYMRQRPSYYVVVEGHCDERGSDEYNRALGERRALAVKDYLIAAGIDAGRIRTISYGEERPAVAGAGAEADHAKNRRAEFLFGVTP